ncbi:MAG: hypothetical protein WAS34_18990 [Thiolinea sp.]
MTKGQTFQIKHDDNIIEYKETETHYFKTDGKQGVKKVKLDEPNLIFNYLKSSTKKGDAVFKESDFNRLLKMENILEV